MVGDDVEKWQAGFDRVDIAPKDGQLSLEEICAYRDKQIKTAKFIFWINPRNWLNPKAQVNFSTEIYHEKLVTSAYRAD